MRVLIVQPWIRAGGAELLSLQLSAALERRGDDAPIAALYVRPHGLPATVADRRFLLPPRWLASMCGRSRTFSYLLGPVILFWVVLAAANRADVLNPHNLPAPLAAGLVGRIRSKPVVWTCNEVPEPLPKDHAARLGRLETLVWWVGSRLSGFGARSAREILVLSEKTRTAVRAGYGRDATVIRPGVELSDFVATHRRAEGPFGLLYVAKLHPQKDPLLAVRVLAEARRSGLDARLTMIGDGPERAAIHDLARSLSLDRYVTITRDLDLSSLVEHYRRSDALIVTAGGHQSWGLTPFEALAAGTPSVISADAGASEVLGPADAALVVRRDAAAFAEGVRRLAGEPELGARLVAHGRALVAELTWDRYGVACREAFGRALGRA